MKYKDISNRKIKLLMVCTVPTGRSGIPQVIFNLLKIIDKDRFEIGYVSINTPDESYIQKLSNLGVKLYIIPRSFSNIGLYISKLRKIAMEYDIIHVHGNSATMALEMIAAKMAGVKVRIAHSHNTTCNWKVIDYLARSLFYSLCNGRLACGIEAGKWLFKNKSFNVINNGIEVENFRFNLSLRQSIRYKLGLTNEQVIGHIGNFVDQKNHKYLIEIFRQLQDIHKNSKLLLLGDGPLRISIQSKVEELDLTDKVIFVGSVEKPQDYMNAMDVVVMPSLFEGLPLTLIEEQANGLSIIAADTISPDANLTNNIHFLSLTDKTSNWTRAILNCIQNNTHSEYFSDEGISQIKKAGYDLNTVVGTITQYYENSLRQW